jgi:hypothetical protein
MRARHAAGLSFLLIAIGFVGGDEPRRPEEKDYAEFSKLIHQVVVKQLPKVFEDSSGWGQTVPIPPKLTLPKLRTRIKVGDKEELPHGLWRKIKVWMTTPAKDLQIRVRDFKSVDGKTYRLVIEADALLHADVDAQHWQKGLTLGGFTAQADVALNVLLNCDVQVSLVGKKFPPELKIEPKITDLKTDLKDFTLKQVAMKKIAIGIEGDAAKDVGNKFKDVLQQLLHSAEPAIKAKANEAIAKSLQDGKGTISAGEMMKALSLPGKKDGK